jgi:hypothetical protein
MLQSQVTVARAETVPAMGAVEIGAFEGERPEQTLERLSAPSHKARGLAAITYGRILFIGMIGIEPLLDGMTSKAQDLPAHGVFECLQVEIS